MSRQHPEVKIMRAPFTGSWYAVRERGGVVTDKWPVDVGSSRQLDDMRERFQLVPVADQVSEFHEAFGLAVGTTPAFADDLRDLRVALLREEFEEYLAAEAGDDLVEVADALGDMVYVIFGTALTYGVDLNAVLAEIHRSNMSKLGEDGKPVLREDGKVVKGPYYFRPNLAHVLAGQKPMDRRSDAD